MASNLTNLDTTTLGSGSMSSANKSLYIGAYPAGPNWSAIGTECNKIYLGAASVYPAVRSLLNSTVGSRKIGDTNNTGAIDLSDVLNFIKYGQKKSTLTSLESQWISTYVETYMSNNSATFIAEGSFYNPASASGTVAIIGGTDPTILSDPMANLDKLFFYSGFDYLRVRSAVSFTISLPARNTRSSGGGKKGGSSLTSYNGYSDRYIFYHNYGTPTPAFSMYLDNDVSNGSYAGMALAGSVPIQYQSNNSFRMALVYSTDKYLVLRERYQVYQQSLPAMTLKATAYFYNNPTSINSQSGLGIVHSPTTFNDVSPYASPVRGRVYTNTATFTSTGGTTFNKVEVMRFGGGGPTSFGNPYQITTINGSAVTPYDPYNAYTTYTYGSQQTTWTMGIKVTDIPKTDAIGKNKYVYYTPRYAVRFTNTSTGQTFTDSWGGVISFYIYL